MSEQSRPPTNTHDAPVLEPVLPPELAPVRRGEDLDWERIETYLRANLPEDLGVDASDMFEVLQFPNGAANLTYLIRFGEHELVLRRPPFGELAPGAHSMKREYKVLSRLWRHFERAPRAYLFCQDPEIAGADFFVMQRCRGEVIRGVIPKSLSRSSNVGRRLGQALVEAIADFHRLDPDECDLGDLGRPVGFVERQVSGWKKRWDLVANPDYDALMNTVHTRLAASLPEAQRVSLVHNDLKLDNCMFDANDPDRVIAFFDWDMTTLGDPLIDFGTLLNYWPDPSDGKNSRGSHVGMESMGLPTRAEMRKLYADASGLNVSQIGWYEAFALWKTATVLQQLHHRWLVGDSTDERMASIGSRIPELVESAAHLLEAASTRD